MKGWRDHALTLVEIGRSLKIIEHVIRECNATAVVDDAAIQSRLNEAYTAARKLADRIDSLRRSI